MTTIPYHCWCPDYKISLEEAKTMHAFSEREVSEQYAEYLYTFFSARFSSIEVHVKEANNHYAETNVYHVNVLVKPTFNAYKTGGRGMVR